MANQQHSITVPPELVKQWLWSDDYSLGPLITITSNRLQNVATQAAQWGADQELAACCEWLYEGGKTSTSDKLRDARRPKPSLKEQALEVFEALIHGDSSGLDVGVIRRALEALPND
jgi:hypothetical protein